ncbi:MAG TPA: type II toxin-antitoxin system VapC family toxin [Candidatus Methylomirabilis sp.]
MFARITALLQQQGKPAGDMDVLIAATALVAGESLVTANPTHFRNIPGLTPWTPTDGRW